MRLKEYVKANLGMLALLVDTMKKVERGRINYKAAANRLEVSSKQFDGLLDEFYHFRPEKKSRPWDSASAFVEYYRADDGAAASL